MDMRKVMALFADSDDPETRKHQLDGLRHAIVGLAQDVHVLKQALREAKLLEAPRFKALRMERMVGDHNGAGAMPWRHHSYFPYLLEEEDYLRMELGATDEEIRSYEAEVDYVSSLS